MIFRSGTERLVENWDNKLKSLYTEYEQERVDLAARKVKEFQDFIGDPKNNPKVAATTAAGKADEPGGSSATEGSSSSSGTQEPSEDSGDIQGKEP